MKKKILGLMIIAFLLTCTVAFAADGDLIVNGKLGVGTTSPGVKLDVQGIGRFISTSGGGTATFIVENDQSSGYTQQFVIQGHTNQNNALLLGFDTVNNYAAIQALTQGVAYRNLILSPNGGNVGIGTTGPSYRLHLSTDSAAKPSTGTWTIASDSRLKTEIQPYKKGLSEVLQINPITYKYNGKGGIGHNKVTSKDPATGKDVETDVVDTELLSKTNVGVIAQDIQPVVPEAVTSHKGKINDDDTVETDILDFNSHSFTFILINAVKELKAQIDSLNQQLADLKEKIK